MNKTEYEILEHIAHMQCLMKFRFIEIQIYVYMRVRVTVRNAFPTVCLQQPPHSHLKFS